MTTPGQLDDLAAWFDRYVRRFTADGPALAEALRVKREHSLRVREEAERLAGRLAWPEPDRRTAAAAGLVHDVGRFEQLSRYRTFSDRLSVNHAELGVSVLQKEGALDGLPRPEADRILRAVANHNRKAVPGDERPEAAALSRLLRDADKLDIFRILIDFYRTRDGADDTVGLGLTDAPDISPGVVADLLAGRLVDSGHLRTLNDFKLMKLGWVYDLNYAPSFEAMAERGYLRTLRSFLPDLPEVDRVFAGALSHLEAGAGRAPSGKGSAFEDQGS